MMLNTVPEHVVVGDAGQHSAVMSLQCCSLALRQGRSNLVARAVSNDQDSGCRSLKPLAVRSVNYAPSSLDP